VKILVIFTNVTGGRGGRGGFTRYRRGEPTGAALREIADPLRDSGEYGGRPTPKPVIGKRWRCEKLLGNGGFKMFQT
jgi:hypothetical protein